VFIFLAHLFAPLLYPVPLHFQHLFLEVLWKSQVQGKAFGVLHLQPAVFRARAWRQILFQARQVSWAAWCHLGNYYKLEQRVLQAMILELHQHHSQSLGLTALKVFQGSQPLCHLRLRQLSMLVAASLFSFQLDFFKLT
jgi:hypothetical protein